MKSISLEGTDHSFDVRTRQGLLGALLSQQLDVLHACGGRGLCATCHVKVTAGADMLSPLTEREERTLTIVSGTSAQSRLACQARVLGDCSVEVPRGRFIEKTADLTPFVGKRTEVDILHPIDASVIVPKGKIITKSRIAELRELDEEVRRLQKEG